MTYTRRDAVIDAVSLTAMVASAYGFLLLLSWLACQGWFDSGGMQ